MILAQVQKETSVSAGKIFYRLTEKREGGSQ